MRKKYGKTKMERLRKSIGLLFFLVIMVIVLFIGSILFYNHLIETNIVMPSAVLSEESTYVEMASWESLPSMKEVIGQIEKYEIGTTSTQLELNPDKKIWGVYSVYDSQIEIVIAGIPEEESAKDAMKSTFANAGIYQFKGSEVSYVEKVSQTGSLNGFLTSYTAGKITLKNEKQRYVMLYKIKLGEDKNMGIAVYTEDMDKLEEAKECLDLLSYHFTYGLGSNPQGGFQTVSENAFSDIGGTENDTPDRNSRPGTDIQKAYEAGQAIEKEPGMYAALTPNDYTQVADSTQQVKVVGNATIIKDVNYDYTIELISPYECLRVVYNYIDVNKEPDSVVLISPSGDYYYPADEKGLGEIIFYVEHAEAGSYTLSVRSSESLGGSFVTYCEKSEYEAGLSDNKYE